MATDLSGGLPVEREYFLDARPGAEVRDATNVWLEEEAGDFAMRIGIEGVAEVWDNHELWLDVAFPDGRVLNSRDRCRSHPPIGPDGKPTVLGTGPLQFRCVEPFRLWTIGFERHPVSDITTRQLIEARYPDPIPRAEVAFAITMRPAVPPLVSGTLTAASRALMAGEQGSFISPRFEQLCRVDGWLEVDGKRRDFKGQALRIKRQGVRRFEGFFGHCWQSALFPSGKAFGVNAFPPRDDGQPSFNEGFVFDGDGPLVAARAVQSPWMTEFRERGEPVPLVLETEDGRRVEIDGTTFVNTRSQSHASLPDSFPLVQQAHARYRWDGEEATGMVERSTFRNKMKL
ncbi:MAG: hypothetical protein KGK11_10690 [Sphingomonadales bacterium]|nr:hypothetical protein [Sphingomonadales bacterium]